MYFKSPLGIIASYGNTTKDRYQDKSDQARKRPYPGGACMEF